MSKQKKDYRPEGCAQLLSTMMAVSVDDYKTLVMAGICKDFKRVRDMSVYNLRRRRKSKIRAVIREDCDIEHLLYFLNSASLINRVLGFLSMDFDYKTFLFQIKKWESNYSRSEYQKVAS